VPLDGSIEMLRLSQAFFEVAVSVCSTKK